jgi:hypothetical protein
MQDRNRMLKGIVGQKPIPPYIAVERKYDVALKRTLHFDTPA